MAKAARPRGSPRPKRGRKPPPENIIFGSSRQRQSGGRKTEGWSARLVVSTPIAFDVDVRPLVEWLSVNLAWHFRRQLLAGELPDGSGRVPNVTSWTRVRSGNEPRLRPTIMLRTGYGADRWWMGPIRGSTHSAARTIKPYGGSDGPKPKNGGAGRDLIWNLMLKRGYDPQSVIGSAKVMVANTLADWLTTVVGDAPGIDVKTVGEALLKDVEDDE